MLDTMGRGEHEQRPSVLSLSQATELGTVYTPAEVAALADLARARRHAPAHGRRAIRQRPRPPRRHPAELTWKAGVDVLSFGATKNGALGVEAVIVFDRALADRLPLPAQTFRPARVEEPLPRRADAGLSARRPLAGQRAARQSDGRRRWPTGCDARPACACRFPCRPIRSSRRARARCTRRCVLAAPAISSGPARAPAPTPSPLTRCSSAS